MNDHEFIFTRSNELHKRALKSIPLATQTFSKSSMMYPRGATPLFIDRGKGPYVWDIDGNRYIDYVLGLMPIVLGYGDPDVDLAILEQLKKGIIFTLPSELETELAEKLIELIPSADMVRFGKNGSDVTSASIRLARAYTGRDKVAIAGYHGWHDWCIGTTTRNLGVPKAIQELSSTFKFNDLDSLHDLLKRDPDGYAAVILEPSGVEGSIDGFLQGARDLTEKYGVVLIFDEIATGFRANMGGVQNIYNIVPDLSTFGKAMANGMPISAIVGRREIMSLMNDIFFSGTFGGEALSLAAALATLNKLEAIDAPTIFKKIGGEITVRINNLLRELGMRDLIQIKGLDWWPRFIVNGCKSANQLLVTSLFRQEMIANGILIGASFNLSIAHNDSKIIDETMASVYAALLTLKKYLLSSTPEKYLRGDLIKPVFQVRV
jgi:glutamate-1-semialdehyde 2,1-aminomutase